MKKILIIAISLIALLTLSSAKEIDIDKAKGTQQDAISSLYPSPAQTDTDRNVTLKAVFNIPLDTKHIKKNDIKLKKLSGKKRKIKGKVSYLPDEKALTFKPEHPLDTGYYEVEIKSLKPIKKEKHKKIKEIRYRFYVPEVINGFKLPPEPDPKVNNATLLGVDFNDNGVRDDLEIWVIRKYMNADYPKHKIQLGLQWGRVIQQIIQNPQNAYEDKKYLLIDKAQECRYRTYEKLGESFNYRIDNKIFNDEYVNKAFNTKERIKAYYIFNGSMGGHVFGDPYFEKPCDFDLAGLEE